MDKPESLQRLPIVLQRTGWSRSSLYAAIKRKEFSAGVRLGARAVAWPESVVSAYIAERIAKSRKAP